MARKDWFWVGLKEELRKVEDNCKECQENAMSKMKTTPVIPDNVAKMGIMERVAADIFHHTGHKYLAVVDRALGYIMCRDVRNESTDCMVKTLSEVFNTFGYPVFLRTDVTLGFRQEFTKWCKDNDIHHETSSPHNSRSNSLAESAVKKAKKIVKRTGAKGVQLQALMQAANLAVTRDGNCPAERFWRRQVRYPSHPCTKRDINVGEQIKISVRRGRRDC